jgi:hypothetical protein
MTATLNKWDILDAPEVGWKPHDAQVKVVSSSARFRCCAAGRRFGKSDIGGHELIPEAFLAHQMRHHLEDIGKRREFWIVGPEYSDSEKEFRVIWNNLKRLGFTFDKPGSYYNAEAGDMHISMFNGRFMINAKSAKYPDSLVGEGLSGVILAEAAKLKERVWDKFIIPTLADFKGWALLTSTPEGRNWFYDKYRLGQDKRITDWASWRFPAWTNPYVYGGKTDYEHVKIVLELVRQTEFPTFEQLSKIYQIDEEILSFIFNMSEETFNQEIVALFTDFVGRVFKRFDAEYHVTDLEFIPGWRTFACVDYGFTNPNVWLLCQEGPWGEINVLDEVYKTGLTAAEFAIEIQNSGLCPSGISTFYPDPASPGDTRQLEQILRVKHTGGTGGLRKDRIDAIRRALKPRLPHLGWDHPDNRATVMFSRRVPNTVREFEDWKYPEKRSQRNNPEEPEDKDNHCPEALGRYFAATGTPSDEAQHTTVHPINVRG